jgi:hypothetical protein
MNISKEEFKNYQKAMEVINANRGMGIENQNELVSVVKEMTGLTKMKIEIIRGWLPILEKKYK